MSDRRIKVFCIFSYICLSDFHLYQNQMFIFFRFLHACYYYTLQIDTNSLAALGCLLVEDIYDTDIESDAIMIRK